MIRWSSTRRWPRCRYLSLFLRLDLLQIRSRRCRNGNHCQPSRRGKWKMEVFCSAAIASVGHCCCFSFWCVYCRCAAVGLLLAVVLLLLFLCWLPCAWYCHSFWCADDPLIYRQIPWFFTRRTIPWFFLQERRSLDLSTDPLIFFYKKDAFWRSLDFWPFIDRSLDFFLQKSDPLIWEICVC